MHQKAFTNILAQRLHYIIVSASLQEKEKLKYNLGFLRLSYRWSVLRVIHTCADLYFLKVSKKNLRVLFPFKLTEDIVTINVYYL